METYIDGSEVAVCLTSADTFWTAFYFIGSISLFFLLPFVILLVLYTIIAWNLMGNPGIISQHYHQRHRLSTAHPPSKAQQPQQAHHIHPHRSNVVKYRKQVIFMLVAVVLSFFLCLLPFRAFTLWIILMPPESIIALGIEGYYTLLYFCRIMLYLNSALNPILYNLMSSKFREGFVRLLGCDKRRRVALKSVDGIRKGTFHTNSTNLSTSSSSMRREALRANSVRSRTSSPTGHSDGERDDGIAPRGIQMKSVEDLGATKKKPCRRQKSFDDIEELEEIDEPTATSQTTYAATYSVPEACVTPFLLQKAITDRCCHRRTYHQ